MGKKELIDVISVNKESYKGNGTYVVKWRNFVGEVELTEIHATDEVDALMKVSSIVEDERMTIRWITVCITLVILALFATIGVSCADSRHSDKEVALACIKAGKAYNEGGPNPDTCK